jgi:hypothetical protein
MADGPQIGRMRAAAEGGDEYEDDADNAQSQSDPHSIHGTTPGLDVSRRDARDHYIRICTPERNVELLARLFAVEAGHRCKNFERYTGFLLS